MRAPRSAAPCRPRLLPATLLVLALGLPGLACGQAGPPPGGGTAPPPAEEPAPTADCGCGPTSGRGGPR